MVATAPPQRMHKRLAEQRPRDRFFVVRDRFPRALRDDAATVDAGAGAEIDDVIRRLRCSPNPATE